MVEEKIKLTPETLLSNYNEKSRRSKIRSSKEFRPYSWQHKLAAISVMVAYRVTDELVEA